MNKKFIDDNNDQASDTHEKSRQGAVEEDLEIRKILSRIAGKWRAEMEKESDDETETVILPPGGLKAQPLHEKERTTRDEPPDTVILTPSEKTGPSTSSPKIEPKEGDERAQRVPPKDELPDTVILTPGDPGGKGSPPSRGTDVRSTTGEKGEVSEKDVLAETIIQTPSESEIDTREERKEPAKEAEEKKTVDQPEGEDFSVETVIIKPGKQKDKK